MNHVWLDQPDELGQGLSYYTFIAILSCNTIDDIPGKLYVQKKKKNYVILIVINIITRINKAKTLTKHMIKNVNMIVENVI